MHMKILKNNGIFFFLILVNGVVEFRMDSIKNKAVTSQPGGGNDGLFTRQGVALSLDQPFPGAWSVLLWEAHCSLNPELLLLGHLEAASCAGSVVVVSRKRRCWGSLAEKTDNGCFFFLPF